MEAETVYYQLKFQSVLEKFLENGYQIKDDVYFSRLLSCLEGKENKEYKDALIKIPYMNEWIIRALTYWEKNQIVPDPYISAFTLHLLGIISEDENVFKQLLRYNVYVRSINLLIQKQKEVSFNISIAHMKLLSYLLNHQSGTQFIIKTSTWKEVLNRIQRPQSTIYVDKELKLLLTKLIENVVSTDQKLCSLIFSEICGPFLNISKKYENQLFCDELELEMRNPMILLGDILRELFDRSLDPNKDFSKLVACVPSEEIRNAVKKFVAIVNDRNFSFDLSKIYILLIFLSLTTEQDTNIETKFLSPILTLLWDLVEKNKTDTIIQSTNLVMNLWFRVLKVREMKYSIEKNDKILVEDQFTICQSVPIVLFCHAISKRDIGACELREAHLTQLFKRLSTDFIRFVYRWRKPLETEQDLLPYGNKTLSYILELKELYTRPTAILVFQHLVYSLMDVIQTAKINAQYFMMFCQQETYLKQLLENLAAFIEYFNISWQDSVESLCVLKASLEFFHAGSWTPRLIVADLNLVRVAIMKYMSPSLALLVDQIANSPLACLGPIFRNKLRDEEWIVRDSTVEVVTVVAEVSEEKFPSLRKIILENDLCSTLFSIALNDEQAFVRTSALNCLSKMIPVKCFWKHLENLGIIARMLLFIKCETEGTVRAAATTLLTLTFRHYGSNEAILQEIYATMRSAALKDLHWEVRYNALDFWNDRLEEMLGNQGMIDGVFPKFTFSSENRKIINLTDVEITKRLKLVLHRLSEIGCLTVLRYSLTDDSNVDVSKKALSIVKKLVELLNRYHIEESGLGKEVEIVPTFTPLSPPMSTESNHFNDEIIERILETPDSALLKDIYSAKESTLVNETTEVRRITSSEFIRFARKDSLEDYINDREKWLFSLNSLGSLLNDILKSYGPSDYNVMDCY